MSDSPRITNALFTSGLQCSKRLYLDYHFAKKTPDPGETQSMIAEVGAELVELASSAFPKGVAIDPADPGAVAQTEQLCRDKKPQVVFHGRFRHEDAEIGCDILISSGDGTLDLFEVKAGVSIKPRHIMDLALQVHVLEKLGYKVRRTSIIHMNRRYLHAGGKHPVHELFKNVDATARVRRHIGKIEGMLRSFGRALDDKNSLELPTGTWCRAPLTCPYLPRCMREGPRHPLVELPNLTRSQVDALHQGAIEDLSQVDVEQQGLTPLQRRVLVSVQSDKLVVEPRVFAELAECEYPMHFVWIESLLEVLPRFERSRPWQKIPFAWHRIVLKAEDKIEHASYFADGKEDPRARFVHTMLDATIGAHTVFFFPHDVEDRLRELVEDLTGEDKARARALLNSPFLEMQALARNGIYHPDFRGEFDLATMYLALVEGATYDDLEVASADAAGAALRKIANTRTRAATRAKLQEGVSAWMRRQAEAMFAIWQRLQSERPQAAV
ncbi:MAG: DUF2779 domain-containing protein [Planctomycetota bacterium]